MMRPAVQLPAPSISPPAVAKLASSEIVQEVLALSQEKLARLEGGVI